MNNGRTSHFKYERIDWSEFHHGYNINKETIPLNNYIIPRNSQYFGSSLDRRALLSDDEWGTVENSESECSNCWKFPCDRMGIEFWLGEKLDLEKPEAAVVVLWSDTDELGPAAFGLLPWRSSLDLLASSTHSLFSLSSVSLSRKSTHRSAIDWRENGLTLGFSRVLILSSRG